MANGVDKPSSITDNLKLQWLLFCLTCVTWYNHIRFAERLSQRISQLAPEHPRMLRSLAMMYFRAERFEDCLEMALMLERQRPEDPIPHVLIAIAHTELGNLREQLYHYEKAWQYSDSIWQPLKRRRAKRAIIGGIQDNLLIQQAEGLPAPIVSVPESELDKVKQKTWMFFEAYGEFLFLSGRDEEALGEFKKEIEADRRRAHPYIRAGIILTKRGDYEEASGYLKRALRATKGRHSKPYARVWLALCDYHLGKRRKARYHLWKWERKLARGSKKDRIRGACIYRALGLNYQGISCLKRIFRFSPDPNLLLVLREMEDELQLDHISIKDLGGAPELYEAEKQDSESIIEGRS